MEDRNSTPTPASGDQEGEEDEEEEEEKESGLGSDEGELDSVGLLFHTLLDNDSSVEQCSLFDSHIHNSDPEDNPADRTPSPSSSSSPPPVARKRSYNTVAKVPYLRFISDPKYASYVKHLVQETEQPASKRYKAIEPSCTVSNVVGIPNVATFVEPEIEKTPSASHPLAGKIRMPKSHSLLASSSFSTGTPDDFQINAG